MRFASPGLPIFAGTDQIQPRPLLSFSPGWFLVRLLLALNSTLIDDLSLQGIHFRTHEMVQSGWFRIYLEENQAVRLVSLGIAELLSLERPAKASVLSSSEFYRVFAAENWAPNLEFLKKIGHNVYIVKDPSVVSDPHVWSVVPHDKPRLLNRFDVGFILDGNHEPQMDGNKLWNVRALHGMGLNGTGEIVSVVDSGLDVSHCSFYDPNHATPFNVTNMNHRKVVRYEAIGDRVDPSMGHGTHVCGILAGKARCENCGLGLYDGVAPGAKIYMHDLGDLKIGAGDLGDVSLPFFMEKMRELGSYIASNSWGFMSGHNDVRMEFSRTAYENPDVLFVFAAGNSYSTGTINVPGNSKNVLSVGAAAPPGSSAIDQLTRRSLYVRYGSEKIAVVNENPKDSIYTKLMGNPIEAFVDEELVVVGKDASGKVVYLENVDANQVCAVAGTLTGAKAIITAENVTCSSITIPMLTVAQPIVVRDATKVSIYPEVINLSTVMRRASLSSQGPSDLGLMKPEVMAPGESTMSASAGPPGSTTPGKCETSQLHRKTGTSMAAPAMSGLMSLARQYFLEGWYKKLTKRSGTPVKPLGTLLKAVAANAAIPMGEPVSTGYGMTILERALGFQGLGVKFANNCSIGSKQHHVFTVKVDKHGSPLTVTMSYLDPAVPATSILPLFADLDLVVVTPSGQLHYGNGFEDSFATTEKVTIDSAAAGTYRIHVFSSEFSLDHKIPYSIFMNGAFSENAEIFPEPAKDCANTCIHGKCSSGICRCQRGYTGHTCSQSVKRIVFQSDSEITAKFKQVSYFWFTLSNNTFTMKTNMKSITRSIFCFRFADSSFRISEPDVLCYKQNMSSMALTFTEEMIPSVKTGNNVNLAVFAVTPTSVDIKFSIDNLVVDNMVVNIWLQIPSYLRIMIICSFAILVGLVITSIILCVRTRKQREIIEITEPAKTIPLSEAELDEKVDFDLGGIDVEV